MYEKQKRNGLCLCGSGKKYKKCCLKENIKKHNEYLDRVYEDKKRYEEWCLTDEGIEYKRKQIEKGRKAFFNIVTAAGLLSR